MRQNIKIDPQELWMKKQARKFVSSRVKNTLLLLLLTGCAFAAAWVEVPY